MPKPTPTASGAPTNASARGRSARHARHDDTTSTRRLDHERSRDPPARGRPRSSRRAVADLRRRRRSCPPGRRSRSSTCGRRGRAERAVRLRATPRHRHARQRRDGRRDAHGRARRRRRSSRSRRPAWSGPTADGDGDAHDRPRRADGRRCRSRSAGMQGRQRRSASSATCSRSCRKLGCNAGTCHGAQDGKNGFKLSLRGYDPLFDHPGPDRRPRRPPLQPRRPGRQPDAAQADRRACRTSAASLMQPGEPYYELAPRLDRRRA